MRAPLLALALTLNVGPCKSVVRVAPWPDGSPWRVSTWSRGRLDGPWRELHPDGVIAAEGRYVAGLREGTWTISWPDGSPRATHAYAGGLRHGPSVERHEGGVVRVRGAWERGDRVGAWEHFDPSGRLVARETFERGTRASIERF